MPIQFPSRDLTNQFISTSYQDVVQRYNTPPTEYLLDGLGYVIISVPSASLGNGVITTDQTASYAYQSISSSYAQTASLLLGSIQSASYALTASYAVSSSISNVALVADVAFLADTASVAALADYAISASWASQSLSASWANPLVTGSTVPITASWALNAINGGTQLITGSIYPITASSALTSSLVNIVATNASGNLYLTFVSSSGTQQLYIDTSSIYYVPATDTLFVNFISASTITASIISASGQVTVPTPIEPSDAATKEYVDLLNPQGLQAYLRADPSDLPGYYQMHDLSFPLSASAITLSTASVTTNENIFVFASDGIGVTNINEGNFPVHFHAWFTGAGNSALSVVPEFWLLSGSTEIFVADERPVVLDKTVDKSYTADITLTSSIVTHPTDRAILKFRVSFQNANPTAFMNVDGKTSAGIIIPVPSSNFVLKSGDTMTGNLTAPSFTGPLIGTASWAINAINGGTQLVTGSTYPITASWAESASVAVTASYAGMALSSSYAQTASVSIIIFSNITQSFTISASWASSSLQAQFATQSIQSTQSLFAISASWASSSISAAYAPVEPIYSASVSTQFSTKQDSLVVGGLYPITASWAQTSSWAINAINGGTQLVTGSTYPITASWANNSINSQNAVTASFALTSSYLIYPSTILTAISNSTTQLISIPNTIYNSIFATYILNDTQNFRAGNVVVLYNTQSAVMTETSTTDLGDSSGLTLSASLSASNVNLLAINATANNYTVKYHFDVL